MTVIRFIGPEDIKPHLSIECLIDPVADAFRALSNGDAQAPVYVLHPDSLSDIHVKAATIKNWPIFTVKMAGWSQLLADRGEPPSSGMIAVFDTQTCRPIAILQDEHLVSDYRTAAAGAVAARALARAGAKTAAIIGTGTQARLQAQAVALVRPIETIFIWGRSPEKSKALARDLSLDLPGVKMRTRLEPRDAVIDADIIVTATTAREPIVEGDWLQPGQHLTSVGADDATKCEIAPEVFARASLVAVDAVEAAEQYGNIRRALHSGAIDLTRDIVELGAILNNNESGRRSEQEITIASLVGLGVQDLAAVKTIYNQIV